MAEGALSQAKRDLTDARKGAKGKQASDAGRAGGDETHDAAQEPPDGDIQTGVEPSRWGAFEFEEAKRLTAGAEPDIAGRSW